MTAFAVQEKTDWRWWVTPKPLAGKPVHQWFIFPHSFTSELVHSLIEEWKLGPQDRILDPFAGAGTTLVAAKERGISATGYDISPLAVLAARAKVANYEVSIIREAWKKISSSLERSRWTDAKRKYPELVRKALPGKLLGAFECLASAIENLKTSNVYRNFFKLALFTTLPRYSRAAASGGWLKWTTGGKNVTSFPDAISAQVKLMIEDLGRIQSGKRREWTVKQGDARLLTDGPKTYSAVITSPPYPNRHDYTRVFGVELMFGFLDWEETRELRYQSFHSHPEAHPIRPSSDGYTEPTSLRRAIQRIEKKDEDPRVLKMLEGYFLDLYLSLREVRRVCNRRSQVGYVVGNARYRGISILVDELLAEVGEQAGLKCEKIVAARYRGNSAQQMGEYGRKPSRESVVIFRT